MQVSDRDGCMLQVIFTCRWVRSTMNIAAFPAVDETTIYLLTPQDMSPRHAGRGVSPLLNPMSCAMASRNEYFFDKLCVVTGGASGAHLDSVLNSIISPQEDGFEDISFRI